MANPYERDKAASQALIDARMRAASGVTEPAVPLPDETKVTPEPAPVVRRPGRPRKVRE